MKNCERFNLVGLSGTLGHTVRTFHIWFQIIYRSSLRDERSPGSAHRVLEIKIFAPIMGFCWGHPGCLGSATDIRLIMKRLNIDPNLHTILRELYNFISTVPDRQL